MKSTKSVRDNITESGGEIMSEFTDHFENRYILYKYKSTFANILFITGDIFSWETGYYVKYNPKNNRYIVSNEMKLEDSRVREMVQKAYDRVGQNI